MFVIHYAEGVFALCGADGELLEADTDEFALRLQCDLLTWLQST